MFRWWRGTPKIHRYTLPPENQESTPPKKRPFQRKGFIFQPLEFSGDNFLGVNAKQMDPPGNHAFFWKKLLSFTTTLCFFKHGEA